MKFKLLPEPLHKVPWLHLFVAGLFFSAVALAITFPVILSVNQVAYAPADFFTYSQYRFGVFIPIWLSNVLAWLALAGGGVVTAFTWQRIGMRLGFSLILGVLQMAMVANAFAGSELFEWIAAVVLVPVSFWMTVEAVSKRQIFSIVGLHLLAFLVAVLSIDAALLMLFFSTVFLAASLLENWKSLGRYLKTPFVSVWIGMGLLVVSFLWMYSLPRLERDLSLTKAIHAQIDLSSSIFYWTAPLHYLQGVSVTYLGFAPLLLLAYLLLRKRSRTMVSWLVVAGVGLVFSLGPFLSSFGDPIRPFLPLPYLFMVQVLPFGILLRFPVLYFAPGVIALLTALGLGLQHWLDRYTRARQKQPWLSHLAVGAAALFLILGIAEVSLFPAPTNPFHIVQSFALLEQLEVEGSGVLDMRRSIFSEISDGERAYIEERFGGLELLTDETVPQSSLVAWRLIGGVAKDIFPSYSLATTTAIARQEGIDYVALSRSDREFDIRSRQVRQLLMTDQFFENDAVSVLRIEAAEADEDYFTTNAKWSEPRQTRRQKLLFRWMRVGAQLDFSEYDEPIERIELRINTGLAQQIGVFADGRELYAADLEPGTHDIVLDIQGRDFSKLKFDLEDKVKVFVFDLVPQ